MWWISPSLIFGLMNLINFMAASLYSGSAGKVNVPCALQGYLFNQWGKEAPCGLQINIKNYKHIRQNNFIRREREARIGVILCTQGIDCNHIIK